jgi:hypothetical protein
MTVHLDGATDAVYRPEPRVPAAVAKDDQAATTPATPVAVTAAGKSERSRLARENDDRRDEVARPDRHGAQSAAADVQSYERRLVYERELKRTFLDVVDSEDGQQRLMRIPPEKLVRFLSDLSDGGDRPDPAPTRVDTVT